MVDPWLNNIYEVQPEPNEIVWVQVASDLNDPILAQWSNANKRFTSDSLGTIINAVAVINWYPQES